MKIDLDVIGTIYTPGTYDADGNTLTPAVQIPGYHVNTTFPVGGWESFQTAGEPGRRVFGGHQTIFYAFTDIAEYEAYLATADLTKPSAPPTDTPVIAGVPQSVTMRQARLALLAAGLLPAVDAAIAAMPEPDKSAAQITWEFAATVDRGFGMVPALASSMGMTEADIDALFIAAAQL